MRIEDLERECTDEQAEAFFDSLSAVMAGQIFGRWRGTEVHSGHPLQGLLEGYGWYGKELIDLDTVHPLLFQGPRGDLFTVDPRKVPMDLASHMPRKLGPLARRAMSLGRSVIETSEPRARLRDILFRGQLSAAMIYDHLPIVDHFRAVDDTTLLGVMDRRGDTRPFYFVLRKDLVSP